MNRKCHSSFESMSDGTVTATVCSCGSESTRKNEWPSTGPSCICTTMQHTLHCLWDKRNFTCVSLRH